MQRVPDAGYDIIGLPVAGFDRKNLLKNFSVIWKLMKSQWKAFKVIKDFRPQAAVGVGGYASGPTLKVAALMGIPTLIQEQNSYAGVTNKLLAKSAHKICVAYEGMERFFPKDKIILTGNPVRQGLLKEEMSRQQAHEHFGLDAKKKTILVVGGSLGARTLNECMMAGLDSIKMNQEVQFIWQTGALYLEKAKEVVASFTGESVSNGHVKALPNLYVTDFIKDMAAAYRAADLVISRAGAGSISEFCLLGKPVILVPSPNVAEDHQTANAKALVQKDAALYVKDSEAVDKLMKLALETINDDEKVQSLNKNILTLALPHSAQIIAEEVLKLIKKK